MTNKDLLLKLAKDYASSHSKKTNSPLTICFDGETYLEVGHRDSQVIFAREDSSGNLWKLIFDQGREEYFLYPFKDFSENF